MTASFPLGFLPAVMTSASPASSGFLTNVNCAIIDPRAFRERSFVSVQANPVIVPPNSFALTRSIEHFRIPRDVLTICFGKSTYARCGFLENVTPFEPE